MIGAPRRRLLTEAGGPQGPGAPVGIVNAKGENVTEIGREGGVALQGTGTERGKKGAVARLIEGGTIGTV